MSILKNLNSKQQEAVAATEGPVLIIAGPGSGKTKVLTHRVAYLIREKQIGAHNILAVTFTNKAAQEMKIRIKILLNETEKNNPPLTPPKRGISNFPISNFQLPIIGTFHSVCVRILRREIEKIDFKNNFVIYDSADQLSLVKKIMAELNISAEQFNPSGILSQISKAKNELFGAEKYAAQAEGYFEETVVKIYGIYEQRLKDSSALDFDDLIMKTVHIFQKYPAILKKYQERFKYVLVDEYQDTNHAQYALVNLISRARNNLCVVGDDWQSIYRWRGADIRNILEFEKDYPDAKVILLEQNYRSTQKILDAAASIIDKNTNRKNKKLWTEKNVGYPVIVYEAQNERGEANFVLTEIAKLQQQLKLKLNDFAVLYRTNAQSRALEEECLKFEAPYRIVGGIKFYARAEIKNILAYLKFIQNPNDLISLERIINIPARGIGEITFGKISKLAKELKG
ncbi:MAG: UvrD-helicase domain-containing protein, partial [Nitrospiraceae bacterium]|nr:UvrD-helicase domain-containing protein [Nitrospiraceae bacterium]